MRVVVVGATGVLGRSVIPRLIERGHSVRAVVRRPEQARVLERVGVEAMRGDMLDPASLDRAVAGCDAALHLATAVPRPGATPHWDMNDRIRRDGTRYLLDAATRSGARRYVQQSIALVYGEQGPRIANESTPLAPGPLAQSAVDMEGLVRASALDWRILRGGIFYGPGTGREESWRAAARAGMLRAPGDGTGLVSLIHVADMARAVVLALDEGPPHATYNVVDDMPVTWRELYGYVAAQEGGSDPAPGGPVALPSLGCGNARIKADLGWWPAYPTYRSGLAQP
jgi:nucleoside-diphosphate-sugar epimerase